MRLPDEHTGIATVEAALEAGITVFDTARAYDGNERLLARALRGRVARVVTKGGMSRVDGRWIPDGRAKAIRSDCESSLAALDGLPIDLYLVHAPDPRTPWRTTVRALAKLLDDGLVRRIGVSNVNRRQLDEALELAPIAALEVGLSVFDDSALRGGLVDRCVELDIALIAHSSLGGPRRTRALARDETLAGIATARDVTPAQVALAWLLGLAPVVVPICGARRPEAARAATGAPALQLSAQERDALDRRFGVPWPATATAPRADGEVVLVMGIPGAGKSRIAAHYVARGYVRLNRDERGGSLRDLDAALEEKLAGGARRIVLDNTYLTRAARNRPLAIAARSRVPMRCVWLDTPLAQAQVNMVLRLLERFGALPQPEELAELGRTEQGVLAPTSQMRTLRQLEQPAPDEGFAAVERIEFARALGAMRGGVFVAASVVDQVRLKDFDPGSPHLVFDWLPGEDASSLAAVVALVAREVDGPVETAVCPHGGGPPVCWCRPPLPGLPLAFAHAHGLDPAASTLVGHSRAHRTLAQTLGARFVEIEALS